jgi:tetratricopeptide (TPR) repeat protein
LRNACALAAAIIVAGCAGAPEAPQSAGADATTERVVPAAVLTMYEQAVASMAAGDLIDAELRFKEFLMRYPDYPGAHLNLSIIHSTNEDLQNARAAVDAALRIDPEFAPALNQSGVLFRKSGNFSEAEAAYLKAVTVRPDYPLAHYNLGVLYELYFQRLGAALQHFERYRELVGEDEQVDGWIVDLTRRVERNEQTANVAE